MKVLCATVVAIGVLISASVFAKGRPQHTPVIYYDAATVTFTDADGDAIRSDGSGAYDDGVNGVQAFSDKRRTQMYLGDGVLRITLGTLVAGPGNASFGSSLTTDVNPFVSHLVFFADPQEDYPALGTTQISSADHPHAVDVIFAVDGQMYELFIFTDEAGNSEVSAIDLDNDGLSDRRTVSIGPGAVWTLNRVDYEEVVSGKGKKQTVELVPVFTHIGDYSDMPMSFTADRKDYQYDALLPWPY